MLQKKNEIKKEIQKKKPGFGGRGRSLFAKLIPTEDKVWFNTALQFLNDQEEQDKHCGDAKQDDLKQINDDKNLMTIMQGPPGAKKFESLEFKGKKRKKEQEQKVIKENYQALIKEVTILLMEVKKMVIETVKTSLFLHPRESTSTSSQSTIWTIETWPT